MSFSIRFPSNTTFISLTPSDTKYKITQSFYSNELKKNNAYIAIVYDHISKNIPGYVIPDTFCQFIIENVYKAGSLISAIGVRKLQEKKKREGQQETH